MVSRHILPARLGLYSICYVHTLNWFELSFRLKGWDLGWFGMYVVINTILWFPLLGWSIGALIDIATVNEQWTRHLSALFRRRFVNLGSILLSCPTYCAVCRFRNPVCVSLNRRSVGLYAVYQDQVAHSQQPQYGIAYEATAIIILLPCRQQYSNKYII
jgi:hypothetical protein